MKAIHHKDGDPRNNDTSNLELRTMPNHTPKLFANYTWGAAFVCIKNKPGNYCKIARCMPGAYDTPEWEAFAKKATNALNNHDALVEHLGKMIVMAMHATLEAGHGMSQAEIDEASHALWNAKEPFKE